MAYIVNSKQIFIPTTGQTITIVNSDADIRCLINPAGTLLALTIAFPSSPRDGQKVNICSSQILTGLTLTSSQTILGALTTLAAVNGFATYIYDSSATTWYRAG